MLKSSESDKLLIVSAGVTLHEALTASQTLQAAGINIRVLDLFTVKPIDVDGLLKNAKEAGGLILTVEEHYKEGGIHDAVCSALGTSGLSVHGIYVTKIPGSATPEEQL